MQTSCKHYCKPRKSVIDFTVSVNVTWRNYDGFKPFAPKTLVNGVKYLAGYRKTIWAEMTRQRHPALTTAKGTRMAKKPIAKQAESAKHTDAQLIAELTRVKCEFQLRTICAVMGMNPTLNAALITNDGKPPLSGVVTGKFGTECRDFAEVRENP